MIRMKVKLEWKPRPVQRRVRSARERALMLGGGWIRTDAMRSIRTRKTPSAPGNPPHSQTGLLKRGIRFALDERAGTVVVGPMAFNRVSFDPAGRRLPRGSVPNILEFGGGYSVMEERRGTTWRRIDMRRGGSRAKVRRLQSGGGDARLRRRRVTIAPRPYMSRSLKKALDRRILPRRFKNRVGG